MIDTSMNSPAEEPIPPHLVRIALVAGFGSLLLNLGATTLNVALEKLIGDLHTTLDVAQWSITGFLLSLTLVLPLFRWAAARVGIRRLYLASMIGFVLTSALCAAAWSIHSLIAFRILQGAVGGLLTPVAQALTVQYAGPRFMGRLLSIVAISVLAAPLLGPLVGGLLVQRLSWRWVFLINVPLGALCTFLCARVLPTDELTPASGKRLDLLGLGLLSPGMALIIYGISTLHGGHGVRALLAAALLLVAFGVYARRWPERALVDLRLFGQRTVAAALVTYVLASIVSFGGQLLLPLYYQQVRGQTPMQAGMLIGLQGLGIVLTLPRVGALSDRYDPGKLALGGVALALLGTLAFTLASEHTSMLLLGASLVVRGAGLGAINNPALSAVYRFVPKAEVANATTALNIVQRIGAPLGTAIMAVVLQWRLLVAPSKAHAFAQTFTASVAFSALTLVSAAFLLGARARVQPALSDPPLPAR